MAAIFRRPTRLLTIVGGVVIFLFLTVSLPRRDSTSEFGFPYRKGSFDWSTLPQRHPVAELAPLPTGEPRKLPRVQHDFSSDPERTPDRTRLVAQRQLEVKEAFVKSWNGYKKYAWTWDELTPVTGRGKDTFGGWAATLVDTLDTLWIMDLTDEFYEAVATTAMIDYSRSNDTSCNFFETTIRHLGGLLAAYDLSNQPALLMKAVELGDMLYSAFDTPNRMPPFWLDFERAKEGTLQPGNHDPSAAIASSSLEFTRLAQLTGKDKYYDAIDRVTRLLERTQNETRLPGMWPTYFNMQTMDLSQDAGFTLGALADSLYEYLPKMHGLLGGLDPVYEKLWVGASKVMEKELFFRPMLPGQDDILFSASARATATKVERNAEGQHLACFVGGMFGLAGKIFDIPGQVALGERLAMGCAWAYDSFASGVMPEVFNMIPCPTLDPCPWDQEAWERQGDQKLRKGFRNARDPRYILRPEAIESVFYMYRITGDAKWQDIAWQMFQSVRNATETDIAFSAIQDVRKAQTTKLDSMESFWTAETLKYFYLTFAPESNVDLDEYVLNTEAHPLRRPQAAAAAELRST